MSDAERLAPRVLLEWQEPAPSVLDSDADRVARGAPPRPRRRRRAADGVQGRLPAHALPAILRRTRFGLVARAARPVEPGARRVRAKARAPTENLHP